MQGLKMQPFRESLCMQELKVLQFPGSCDFQGFVHARLHIQLFPGILCMQELDVPLSRPLCTKGLQMLLEVLHILAILCTQGFHMLQFSGTLAHKDYKCCVPEILCMEGL